MIGHNERTNFIAVEAVVSIDLQNNSLTCVLNDE